MVGRSRPNPQDITVDDPELAAHAIRLGLVDEFQMIVSRVIVGGKALLPGRREAELKRMEERRLGNGVIVLRYAVRRR